MGRNKGLKQLRIGNNSYYFFNFYGLEVKSSKNWGDFIFNDATLINTEQLKRIIRKEYSESTTNHIIRKFFSNTILLVRKTGTSSSNREKNLDKEKNAQIRSKEITSFIFLVFFKLSGLKFGVSLDSELYESRGFNIISMDTFGNISSRIKNSGDEFPIYLPDVPYKLTRGKIVSIFRKPLFSNIFNIINYRSDANEDIRNAILNFYLSLNTPNPTTQFLGSITSLEVLLKHNSKYSIFTKRKELLLSEKLVDQFINLKDYIENRHKILHSAASLDLDVLYIPLFLFCYLLPIYTELFCRMGSKDQTIKLLDLVIFEKDIKLKKSNYYLKIVNKVLSKYKYLTEYNIFNVIRFYSINHPTSSNYLIEAIYYISRANSLSIDKAYDIVTKHFLIVNPFKNRNEFYKEFEIKLPEFKERVETAIDENWIN